jgi:hypothetical protein
VPTASLWVWPDVCAVKVTADGHMPYGLKWCSAIHASSNPPLDAAHPVNRPPQRRLALAMRVTSVTAEGNLLALKVEPHGEFTNGRRYNNEYHTIMRISEGKISQVCEYGDTQHAHAVWLHPERRLCHNPRDIQTLSNNRLRYYTGR